MLLLFIGFFLLISKKKFSSPKCKGSFWSVNIFVDKVTQTFDFEKLGARRSLIGIDERRKIKL